MKEPIPYETIRRKWMKDPVFRWYYFWAKLNLDTNVSTYWFIYYLKLWWRCIVIDTKRIYKAYKYKIRK